MELPNGSYTVFNRTRTPHKTQGTSSGTATMSIVQVALKPPSENSPEVTGHPKEPLILTKTMAQVPIPHIKNIVLVSTL